MRQPTLTFALILGLLASCSPTGKTAAETPTGTATTFQFATTEELPIDVRVTNAGQPVRGASVTITEPYVQVAATEDSASEATGETLFQGGTTEDGSCRTTVSIPSRFPVVDVIVHVPGMTGPYTNEQLRAKWGPFAPSARLTMAVADLRSVTFELENQ